MYYGGGINLNGSLWLRAAVWQHRSIVSNRELALTKVYRLNSSHVCAKRVN